jgi:hypothetical protein
LATGAAGLATGAAGLATGAAVFATGAAVFAGPDVVGFAGDATVGWGAGLCGAARPASGRAV